MSLRALLFALASLALLSSAPPSMAAPASNTLRWTVDGERGIFGFLVYRAANPEGPFRRLTTGIVPATGKLRYALEDDNVRSGATYYYVIYSVGTNGVKQPLTPVVAKQTR